jgi:hypothetical protein
METDPPPLPLDGLKPLIQPAPQRLLRTRPATLDPNRVANGAVKNECPGAVQQGS